MRIIKHAILFALAVSSTASYSQTYNNLRFEEDWRNAEESGDWGDRLKNITLGPDLTISLGGSARVRHESWENFGFNDPNDDEFTLFRAHLHSDWRFGENVRVFLEGRMTTVNDRDLPDEKRAALDIDEVDIGNAFVEFEIANTKARVGRQELQYGAQRLVSPLDWANNRRHWDGALVRYASEDNWKIDVFVTSPVTVDPEELHLNDTDDDRLFSGIYYTNPLWDSGYTMEAYLLALNTDLEGLPDQDRYTLGGRLYGKVSENISVDSELAWQFGEIDVPAGDDLDISAWMFTLEGTYTYNGLEMKPWITLGLDAASGDSDPTDDNAETFSHLFPLAHAYMGFSDVVGRQNVIDVRAAAGFWPIPEKLRLRGDVHMLQLQDDDDGWYLASGALARGPVAGSNEDDLGLALDFTTLYNLDAHTALLGGYSHFDAGDFIEETGPDDDIHFVYLQIEYKF